MDLIVYNIEKSGYQGINANLTDDQRLAFMGL